MLGLRAGDSSPETAALDLRRLGRPAASGFLLLHQAAGDPGSKWTWFVGNAAECLARALRVKSAMGIVTDAEYQAFPRDAANVKTSAGILQEVVDFAWDATGVATL